jgi:prepilin-type N-terminal cleavage/methylation domain-containing protein
MKNKKGFTLVELLAVIAILALLMIVAVPRFQLVRIYASDKWTTQKVTTSDHMFRYCPKLKGSSGSNTSY